MNVRFAENCRQEYLEFEGFERQVQIKSLYDGRTHAQINLTCEKDIYIGVFFDGTNNNKYRDTPSFSQSNVARLYEVYPGTPAGQTAPKFRQKITNGCSEDRPVFADKPFKASSVPSDEYPYYRKIYVPGLGTPMPDVGDTGIGMQKTGGLAMALLGQVRLHWAMLQLLNQVHAAVFKSELAASIDMTVLLKTGRAKGAVPPLGPQLQLGALAEQMLRDKVQRLWNQYEIQTGSYDPAAVERLLTEYEKRLSSALIALGDNKPHLRKIRLSVFGFSRGAAAARAWVNMVTKRWNGLGVGQGKGFAGVTLQVDFLGIFDTVASVGLAQSTPHFNGHAAWADDLYMPVPAEVKRCAHLVAALEVRGAFPLDSVCQGGMLPSNCKEIVYPGVHSDVGGGYPPDDQGRASGQGAVGDQLKLSQISLAQMYREARMAGVPLAPESAMLVAQKVTFAISPQLREDFNAYVAATRSGKVAPTQGKGESKFGSMFPTETQPREELHRVIRRHAGYSLRWRKTIMERPGGIAGLPGLKACETNSRFQDVEDFRGAEAELRKEIAFLRDPDPKKFQIFDDPFFDNNLLVADIVGGAAVALPLIGPVVSALTQVASWGIKHYSLSGLLHSKQEQWDSWLREEWERNAPDALPTEVQRFYERYVHDSRAWFKIFCRTDGAKGMAPDDEEWFVYGGREKECRDRTAQLKKDLAEYQRTGQSIKQKSCQKQLDVLQKEGQPIVVGAREPYRMWGYVRHRRLYESGKLVEVHYNERQGIVDREETERTRKERQDRNIASENTEHDAKIKRITDQANEALTSGRMSSEQEAEYRRATTSKIARENESHDAEIKRLTSASI